MFQYRIALQSLRMNRVRTGLTTLGIIIGVASITLVLSLGGGAETTVRRQVDELGNKVMLIKPGYTTDQLLDFRAYNPYGIAITTSLTELDLNTVQLDSAVEQVSPIMILDGSVRTDNRPLAAAPIIATTPEFIDILDLKISTGQFIDNRTDRNTAVIGSNLALELFGTDQVLGRQISVKGRPHTVIGVTKQTKTPINLSGLDLDRTIYVSFDDGKSFNQGIAQIQQMIIKVKDDTSPTETQASLEQSLLINHNGEKDFSVLAGDSIATNNSGLFRAIIMTTVLVASITLVVGGIGIMNIMLVGVTERTREIGIRKALGATNRHIFGQFILESLIMCLGGGLIGLGLAYGLAFLIAAPLSFQPALTWQITSIGLGMAFAVGMVFGLYPAIKAARKDPIESLKQYQ